MTAIFLVGLPNASPGEFLADRDVEARLAVNLDRDGDAVARSPELELSDCPLVRLLGDREGRHVGWTSTAGACHRPHPRIATGEMPGLGILS